MLVDGVPVSASLFDFGLYLFHNGAEPLRRGSGPYFYLAKLESHHEARLWNEVFVHGQDALGIPRGSIRATVLIETILAAFEMDEILYELREHAAGLNAGRWDYLFSGIKKFRSRPDAGRPRPRPADDDRPVHARLHGAARPDLPPARRARDRRDGRVHPEPPRPGGQRAARWPGSATTRSARAGDGFDGTWVAHPDLVPLATEIFDARPRRGAEPEGPAARGGRGQRPTSCSTCAVRRRRGHRGRRPGQRPGRARVPRLVAARQSARPPSTTSWRTPPRPRSRARSCGTGGPGRRARRRPRRSTPAAIRPIRDEELDRLGGAGQGRLAEAADLLDRLVLDDDFAEFLTLRAYALLD